MKISIIIASILIYVTASAQKDTIQKSNTTIIVQKLHGDIVKGNKYVLEKPDIKIYINTLKRGLYLLTDTILNVNDTIVTRLVLGDPEDRSLSPANFNLTFDSPVYDCGIRIVSNSALTTIRKLTQQLSQDKKSYAFTNESLEVGHNIIVTVISKKPVNIEFRPEWRFRSMLTTCSDHADHPFR
jgi:hypothetical protein